MQPSPRGNQKSQGINQSAEGATKISGILLSKRKNWSGGGSISFP